MDITPLKDMTKYEYQTWEALLTHTNRVLSVIGNLERGKLGYRIKVKKRLEELVKEVEGVLNE